jgi:hypothetical protein
MITVALVLLEMLLEMAPAGMIEASMTRSPSRPCTRNSVSPNPDPLALNLATAIALRLARSVLSQQGRPRHPAVDQVSEGALA